jgi:hypothetical protein
MKTQRRRRIANLILLAVLYPPAVRSGLVDGPQRQGTGPRQVDPMSARPMVSRGMTLTEARDLERRIQDRAWAWAVVGRADLRRSIETGVPTVMWDHEGVSWFSWFSQRGRWTR